jgi:glycerol uptake facilitator-like aquaporin
VQASAYWFNAATNFTNPSVTQGRAVSDTFAVIPPFIAVQITGSMGAMMLAMVLFTRPNRAKAEVQA